MVSESLQTSAEQDDLPPFEPPEPVVPAGDALPSGLGTTLVTSEWSYPEQCRALKRSVLSDRRLARSGAADVGFAMRFRTSGQGAVQPYLANSAVGTGPTQGRLGCQRRHASLSANAHPSQAAR